MRSLGFEPRNDEIRQLTIQLMQNTVKREEHPGIYFLIFFLFRHWD